MKAVLLSSPEEHMASFRSALAEAVRVDVAVAWAKRSDPLALLCEYAAGGGDLRVVVGQAFYATAPSAVRRLLAAAPARIRWAWTPLSGTFHPKVFVFHHAEQVVAMVGSANLTRSAFLYNVEATMLMTGTADELGQILRFVENRWDSAEEVDPVNLAAYTENWKAHRQDGGKPSLLEAFARQDVRLNDVAFDLYTLGGDMSTREVREAAGRGGARLPPGNDDWEWFQEPGGTQLLRTVERHCRGRPLVTWEVEYRGGRTVRFKPHDALASPVLCVFLLRGHVVTVLGTTGFVTPFDLRRDRRKLAAILTAGLRSAPPRLRTRIEYESGAPRLSWKDMVQLYRLGVAARRRRKVT